MSSPRAAMSVATSTFTRPALKSAERPRSRALALVAVNDRRLDAGALEVLADAIRAALGLAEHERLPRRLLRQHVRQHGALLIDARPYAAGASRSRRPACPSETSTRAGLRVNSPASPTTASDSVAEKSSV